MAQLSFPESQCPLVCERTLKGQGPLPFRRIRRLLYAKYPQYPTDAALRDNDSAVVEVIPTRVFAWGFE